MTKKKRSLNNKNKVIVIIAFIILIAIITLIVSVLIKKNSNGHDKFNEPVNEKFSFLLNEKSTYLENVNVFNEQTVLVDKIKKEYNSKRYTLKDPLVKVNPFMFSPQTALVMFKTSKSEKVKVTLKGKHNDDLVTNFEKSKDHIIPIYGLYGDYSNKVIIETESGEKKELTIKLKKTTNSAKVDVLENNVKNSNGEFYFGTAAIGVANIAYDNYGEVRWFLSNDYSKGMTMLSNGNMLISDNNIGPEVSSTSGVVEIDMLGYIVRNYELEGGYHHDALEMDDGNLLILTSDLESDTLADYVVLIDRKTGKNKKTWDIKEIVNKVSPGYVEYGDITWAWINSIEYDKDSNELILSIRNRNSVLALDYDTGDIKWILGDIKYWNKDFAKYILNPSGEDFSYPLGQHSLKINGDELSLFNNGYDAFKEKTLTCNQMKGKSSYAMVYKINREEKKAEVTYKYGGPEYFSFALSSYTPALNNHMIFNSGWHFSEDVKYDDPDCTQFSNDSYDSYIIDFGESKNVSVKLKIYESKFEVIKAPIYNLSKLSIKPNNKDIVSNYKFNSTSERVTNVKERKYEILTESEALQYKEYESNEINFTLIDNRISLVGVVPDDMDLKFTFISLKGNAYRFDMKDKNGEVYNNLDLNILPTGKYYIYVNLDEFIFNTKQFVEIDNKKS